MSKRRRQLRSARRNSSLRQGYASPYTPPPLISDEITAPVLSLYNLPPPSRGGLVHKSIGRRASTITRSPVGFVGKAPRLLPSTSTRYFASSSSRASPSGLDLINHWSTDRIPEPRGSSVCSKRAARRSVLFSKNLTSAGAASKRKHTVESSIHCGGHS